MMFMIDRQTKDDPRVEPAALAREFHGLFSEVALGAYSVLDERGAPATFTAYTAFVRPNAITFFSPVEAEHLTFLKGDPQFACALWQTPTEHGEGLRGMQLFGRVAAASEANREACIAAYGERFPATVESGLIDKLSRGEDPGGMLVGLRIERAKMLFEPSFGRRNFISVRFQ